MLFIFSALPKGRKRRITKDTYRIGHISEQPFTVSCPFSWSFLVFSGFNRFFDGHTFSLAAAASWTQIADGDSDPVWNRSFAEARYRERDIFTPAEKSSMPLRAAIDIIAKCSDDSVCTMPVERERRQIGIDIDPAVIGQWKMMPDRPCDLVCADAVQYLAGQIY